PLIAPTSAQIVGQISDLAVGQASSKGWHGAVIPASRQASQHRHDHVVGLRWRDGGVAGKGRHGARDTAAPGLMAGPAMINVKFRCSMVNICSQRRELLRSRHVWRWRTIEQVGYHIGKVGSSQIGEAVVHDLGHRPKYTAALWDRAGPQELREAVFVPS